MNKNYAAIVIFVLVLGAIGFAVFKPKSIEKGAIVGGGGPGTPDRCVIFDTAASRSVTEVIKAAPGFVYSVRASGVGSNNRFVQLYDRTSTPTQTGTANGLATYASANLSFPIAATTASSTPTTIEYIPPAPVRFNTGITFTISNNYSVFASGNGTNGVAEARNYFVTVCYQ